MSLADSSAPVIGGKVRVSMRGQRGEQRRVKEGKGKREGGLHYFWARLAVPSGLDVGMISERALRARKWLLGALGAVGGLPAG